MTVGFLAGRAGEGGRRKRGLLCLFWARDGRSLRVRVAGFNGRKAVSENAISYQIKTVGYMSIVSKYILKC